MDNNELEIIFSDSAITDLNEMERNNAEEIAKMFHKGCQVVRCCGVETEKDLVGMQVGLLNSFLLHLFLDIPKGVDYRGYDDDIELISSV